MDKLSKNSGIWEMSVLSNEKKHLERSEEYKLV